MPPSKAQLLTLCIPPSAFLFHSLYKTTNRNFGGHCEFSEADPFFQPKKGKSLYPLLAVAQHDVGGLVKTAERPHKELSWRDGDIDGGTTVDGSEILRSPVEVGSLSHYL